MAKKDEKPESSSKKKAKKLGELFTERKKRKKPGDKADKELTFSTPNGDVELIQVEYKDDGEVGWVDVLVDSPVSGDPSYHVVNPPLYVEDPAGDVVIGNFRYREDPLAALAYSIASQGGSRKGRRR